MEQRLTQYILNEASLAPKLEFSNYVVIKASFGLETSGFEC